MKIVVEQYEQDWLGSHPLFYNTKTLKVSSNINDVIDYDNIDLDPEGFNNYLDFGYSVLEQTPVKNVKFLRYSSILNIYDDKTFNVEYLPDPIDQWFGKTTNEEDVLDLLHTKISKWESSISGEIVLPLSGGFDSRLLASMINDKSRLRCFTYGISHNQSESFEVIHAKKIAEILHLDWRQIELGDIHNYIEKWNSLFGISVHSHGMYHIEFYTKLLSIYQDSNNFLSGIIGDAWAGNISKQIINSEKDLIKLGYTHGMCASSKYSLLPHTNSLASFFYDVNHDKLQYDFYQIITTIRLKIILISYLISVPESFGFSVFTPYLDMEVALSMLCLPAERRKNREWQRDYFKKNKLDIENMHLKGSYKNTLNYDAAHKIRLEPLKYNYFEKCISKEYFDKINSMYSIPSYQKPAERVCEKIMNIRYIRKIFKILHFRKLLRMFGYKESSEYFSLFLEKYNAYLVLKPIEFMFNKKKDNEF
jgi:hypothetical protein